MKKHFPLPLVFTLLLHAVWISNLSAAIEYNLGTSGFKIDPPSTLLPSYSQTETTLTINGPLALGYTFGGLFINGPYNWSILSTSYFFPMMMSISGSIPNIPFSVQLFDSSFSSVTYVGTTFGVMNSPTPVALTLVGSGGSDLTVLTDVVALQFTFDGGGAPASMTFYEVVPEPSTYALLAMSCGGALCIFRNRRSSHVMRRGIDCLREKRKAGMPLA